MCVAFTRQFLNMCDGSTPAVTKYPAVYQTCQSETLARVGTHGQQQQRNIFSFVFYNSVIEYVSTLLSETWASHICIVFGVTYHKKELLAEFGLGIFETETQLNVCASPRMRCIHLALQELPSGWQRLAREDFVSVVGRILSHMNASAELLLLDLGLKAEHYREAWGALLCHFNNQSGDGSHRLSDVLTVVGGVERCKPSFKTVASLMNIDLAFAEPVPITRPCARRVAARLSIARNR